MFQVGEHIIYGTNGICRVDGIGPLPYESDDTRTFYFLIPLNNPLSSSIYTPVDNACVPMRRLMTKDEATELIEAIPQIGLLQIPVEKRRRDLYRATINELKPEGFVQVIKTVRHRRRELTAAHKHFPVTDLEYGRLARHLLYSELAQVLGMEEEDIEGYINERLLPAN